jgi:cysteine desulfurase
MPSYFDHNATTPVDPRVRDAMLPWLGERHGNPSSIHRWGRAAREAVEAARGEVAELLGARPGEVVFTSSGTEANNTVLTTVGRRAGFRGHLVVSALEHPSIRAGAAFLEAAGMSVTLVPPGADGVVDPRAVAAASTADTVLVALMRANNEIGTLQPVAEVAAACRRSGVPVLCDAVQAVGKVPVDVGELGADWVVLGGHKLHGPPGVAALWVDPRAELDPLLVGGGQERRRRASTENVAGIVGLGRAAALVAAELPARTRHLAALRDRFEAGAAALGARLHAAASPRLPNTSHLAFDGVEGEALLIRLDLAGFAVSTGSACASGAVEPSPTLLALGLPPEEALGSIRVSVGMTNTAAEVDDLLAALEQAVAALRRLAPSPGRAAREAARGAPVR